MDEPITKSLLLRELRAARAEWEALLAEAPDARMTEPGVTGDWSVKDIIAHVTSFNRWFVNASEAQFRGELPPLDGTEGMSPEERNQFHARMAREKSLAEVREENRRNYTRLLEVVELHSEEFLTQPQQFEGVPGTFLIWHLLKHDGYDHYREHMQAIRAWLGHT